MKTFLHALERANTAPGTRRRWIYVPYDQLTDRLGPLADTPPRELGIVLVENRWKARRRPYHKQKLALVLANQRHFALEQARRGVHVRYVRGDAPYRDVLRPLTEELGPLECMTPAERELRVDLDELVRDDLLAFLPHEGWLTTREDFRAAHPKGPPWRMDRFYRQVRQRTGRLMDQHGKPEGGRYSYDVENREPWKGDPEPKDFPTFPDDPIKNEVVAFVERAFAHHPGTLRPEQLPATQDDAEHVWEHVKRHALPFFGPYQDAMAEGQRTLFHTRIAPLVHLHRLPPARVVDEALELDLPLSSREGFLRQILGWREFVRHVHEETDGFLSLPGRPRARGRVPGDANWKGFAESAWERGENLKTELGAHPDALAAPNDLPPAFWGNPSGMRCLDQVVRDVWDEGYSHHITRLMVLSNLATLLDVSARQVTDWFWCAYTDAFDWVVEPNVLGMGTHALGDLMTTKPYVCGAAYIDRMSDYCRSCTFHPKKDCPITSLYWAFLERKKTLLKDNPRIAIPLRSLEKRSSARKRADASIQELVSRRLASGEPVSPEDVRACTR